MTLNDNIVTAIITLSASIIGGVITLLGTKLAADKEDRRGREEVSRAAANERIKILYEPLLKLMSSSPPYDDFYIEPEVRNKIISLLEKSERYASSDLLKIFWTFRNSWFCDTDVIERRKVDFCLYETARAEYEDLKKTVRLRSNSEEIIFWLSSA